MSSTFFASPPASLLLDFRNRAFLAFLPDGLSKDPLDPSSSPKFMDFGVEGTELPGVALCFDFFFFCLRILHPFWLIP